MPHINVTRQPHAAWAAQQIVEAIGADTVPMHLIRDRDGVFGAVFDARVERLGIRQLKIAPRSPWQNGHAERFVGTLPRELLDHLIVINERHLLRTLRDYIAYYNNDRPHMSLDGDAPASRPVEPPTPGKIVALPRVGGLHHQVLESGVTTGRVLIPKARQSAYFAKLACIPGFSSTQTIVAPGKVL